MSDASKDNPTENQASAPSVLDADSLSKKYPRNVKLYTTINVRRKTRDTLKKLKDESGFRTYDATLNYMALEVTKGSAIPPADFGEVFKDTKPCLMTGDPGSGKTTAVKEMLSRWEGNVLVIDVTGKQWNEYAEYQEIDDVSKIKWKAEKIQRIRYIPDPRPEWSQLEMRNIFTLLNLEMHSGALQEWVVVVEEAHRFSRNSNLRSLILECRKFTRKVFIVTAEYEAFKGLASVFKPKPWETVLARDEIEQKEAPVEGQPSANATSPPSPLR